MGDPAALEIDPETTCDGEREAFLARTSQEFDEIRFDGQALQVDLRGGSASACRGLPQEARAKSTGGIELTRRSVRELEVRLDGRRPECAVVRSRVKVDRLFGGLEQLEVRECLGRPGLKSITNDA
jgi:hypothetical protein